MKIKWYGQACMLIETSEDIKILTDPYDESLGYKLPDDEVDIVTISHDHFDHNAYVKIKGSPIVIREEGEFRERGIKIKGIHTWHDNKEGRLRGDNIAYKFEIDNINFVHLGDLGHLLSDEQVKELRPCDILAVPVGGVFTINAKAARDIVDQLNPQVVIPMHYATPSNKAGLDSEEEFIKEYLEVKRVKNWIGSRANIPRQTIIYVLLAHGETAVQGV